MKKTHQILSLILCAILLVNLLPLSASAASTPFRDVKKDAWYADAVQYVYEQKLMNGTSDTTFQPEETTTRGMIVTILYRQAGSPDVTAKCPFKDVASGKWYTAPITWAAANGIVNGYSTVKFGPDDTISREQMAAILYRYADSMGLNVSARTYLNGYQDANKISTWAEAAMQWANATGLITGTSATTLSPQGNATRAQAATILMRFCKNIAAAVPAADALKRVEFARMLFDALPMGKALVDFTDEERAELDDADNGTAEYTTVREALERGMLSFGTSLSDQAEAWNEPITTAELAYLIYLANYSAKTPCQLTTYIDMGGVIEDYGDCLANPYCCYILTAVSSGLIPGGKQGVRYQPEAYVTKATAKDILDRLLNEAKRADVEQLPIVHEDAPVYTSYLHMAYVHSEPAIYDTAPVNYDKLESVQKGSDTSTKYGSMTSSEAEQTRAVVNAFLRNYIRPSMSELLKVSIAAEFIMEVCSYGSDDAPRPYTAWGALVGHAAWCTGFSYAMKMLCDSMDIGCVAIRANSQSANPSHMWAAVRIDQYWYILDVQASDLARDQEVYGESDEFTFFAPYLVSAETYMMMTGMRWDVDQYPVCSYDYFN